MKIMVLSNVGTGLYAFRKEVMGALQKRNHQVILAFKADPTAEKWEEMGFEVVDTPISRRGTNPIADLKLLWFYRRLMKKLKPDVVLTYTIKPNVYGGMAARFCKVPYIANITGLGTAVENKGFLRTISMLLYKAALKNAACIFFQNGANQEFFAKSRIIRSMNRIIPGSGVNLEEHYLEEYPTTEEGIRFLFVGRIMRDKGINELCDAMRIVQKQFPNAFLDVVGGFDENYEQLLDSASKDRILTYHGRQEDVHSFYKRCHCVVLPSYHEGTSNVLLESAATGRPVIATRVAGCMETFDEGISGFGCNKKDPAHLAEKMMDFLSLPWEEKKAMGIAGRRKMELEFDRRIVIDAYLQEIARIGEIVKHDATGRNRSR